MNKTPTITLICRVTSVSTVHTGTEHGLEKPDLKGHAPTGRGIMLAPSHKVMQVQDQPLDLSVTLSYSSVHT